MVEQGLDLAGFKEGEGTYADAGGCTSDGESSWNMSHSKSVGLLGLKMNILIRGLMAVLHLCGSTLQAPPGPGLLRENLCNLCMAEHIASSRQHRALNTIVLGAISLLSHPQ